jgi:hypothetical protein
VPIEVLIKYSSQSLNNEKVNKLIEINSQIKESLTTRCNNETNLSTNGIEMKSKRFSLSDFWHLLLRAMTYSYIYQWKGLLIHLLFYIIFCSCITKSYNENVGKYDGCFSFNETVNSTSVVKKEKIRNQ